MNRQEVFSTAVQYVQKQVEDNQELFLAQIIKMHPEINLLDYNVCYQPLPDRTGMKF